MIFEWNVGKAAGNRRKHGVSFELALQVWKDPHLRIRYDRFVDGEERWHAVGFVGAHRLVVVVHVYLDEEDGEQVIRLISARRASREERRRHEHSQD